MTEPTVAEQLDNLQRLRKGDERLIEALGGHTIGPDDLQFLEVPFLKPSAKNPRTRKTARSA